MLGHDSICLLSRRYLPRTVLSHVVDCRLSSSNFVASFASEAFRRCIVFSASDVAFDMCIISVELWEDRQCWCRWCYQTHHNHSLPFHTSMVFDVDSLMERRKPCYNEQIRRQPPNSRITRRSSSISLGRWCKSGRWMKRGGGSESGGKDAESSKNIFNVLSTFVSDINHVKRGVSGYNQKGA